MYIPIMPIRVITIEPTQNAIVIHFHFLCQSVPFVAKSLKYVK